MNIFKRLLPPFLPLFVALVPLVLMMGTNTADAAGAVAWGVQVVAEPSVFAAGDALECAREGHLKCDRYQVLVRNSGDDESDEPVALTVTLPKGLATLEAPESGQDSEGVEWSCTPPGAGQTSLTCTFADPVPDGGYAPHLDIPVTAPSPLMAGFLASTMSAEGDGATGSTTLETPVNAPAPMFGVDEFAFEPDGTDGLPLTQAGGHPWELTTSLGTPAVLGPPGEAGRPYSAVENIKSVMVELPIGVVGDPQTVEECTLTELKEQGCRSKPKSKVGVFDVIGGAFEHGEFVYSEAPASGFCCSAVYNMVPERGYPAEFGFTFATVPLVVYTSVVRTSTGYHVRGVVPGIPAELEVKDSALTFYGEPGQLNGSGSDAALFTNPVDCNDEQRERSSRIELESWEAPGHPKELEAHPDPQLTGCGLLRFNDPSLSFEPSSTGEGGTTQADEPSGFTANLEVPQTSGFSELAAPEVKNLTAVAPAGVSLDPSVATGLVGCKEAGPEGINLGSTDVAPDGRDLGDPEATEFGAGHAGGNDSPYDDGQYHEAPGHCPSASEIGTVEVTTPVLASPLKGRVYVAEPKCGGEGQSPCTEVEAANGELYEGYAELEGSGVIIKQRGSISTNTTTGQLTLSIRQVPQFPFSDLKLHLNGELHAQGGPRAPLATPQACGEATATAVLEPWSAPETPNADLLAPSFNIDWDGHGGACPAVWPFAPSFSAGTVDATGGAFSPFVMSFSRRDREQNLSGVSVTLPQGLLGKLAGIPLCAEQQANEGTCSPESQLGTASALAGAGSQPLYVPGGRVYLTSGYKGQPFGLSVVVPAVAGPFNLGNVVVRAALAIDPHTAQVTVISDPLPQIKDGVPFRLKTVNVEINRPQFTFNPTDCSQQQITGTITGSQGANANVSSPFAVTGCAGLAFKPGFSVSTSGKTSKANGASLKVDLTYPQSGEANIHSVHVELPKSLPARLTTLQKACTEQEFATNPATCPAASIVGHAKAITPILPVPLEGPAYFVSHGGAAFPELIMVLQGYGVTIQLNGETFINSKTDVTSSTFAHVPDAPVTSFELTLPEESNSALAANGNLCDQKLIMPTLIGGQNGAQIKQNTRIEVEGCGKTLSVVSTQVNKKTLKLSVFAPGAGKVSASGKGVSSGSKSYSGVEAQTFTLSQKKAGKLKTSIKLTFTPSKGKKQSKSLTVEFKK